MQGQVLATDRMMSVGTVAAGVVHEVNNPLAALMANLEFLRDGLLRARHAAPGDTLKHLLPELEEPVIEAQEAAGRMREIVRDLRSLSHTDDTRSPVNVERVLEASLKLARHQLRRGTVQRDYAEVPPALGHEGRLGQVFLSLLLHAAQALPERDAELNQIRLSTRWEEGRVVVEVEDTGEGIEPSVLARIFEPFSIPGPPGAGAGLGLAIAQRLMGECGGSIEVHSAAGRGTTFRVSLPAVQQDAEHAR
jgi:signal transduction histidine kinase